MTALETRTGHAATTVGTRATSPVGLDASRAAAGRLGVLGEIARRRREDVAAELGEPETRELARARAIRRRGDGPAAAGPLAPFLRPGLHVIAELKRRSPSAGVLATDDADLVARARAYEAGGAAAISVLVEHRWFGGSLDDLRAARAAVSVPLLAKEFVVDPRQLVAVRDAGADLVLLLAALQGLPALRRLVRQARELGLEPLVEAHDDREVDRALESDARMIGLNNRDLRTLAIDPERAVRLRRLVPDDRLIVAESGVRAPTALVAWRAIGFDAVLVGEALMRAGSSPDEVRASVVAFVDAGRAPSPTEDLAASDRAPWVKICGVVDRDGALAAISAGADAIGLNFVPGTPRCLAEPELRSLADEIRRLRGGSPMPRIVGVAGEIGAAEAGRIARAAGLEALQWTGPRGVPDEVRLPAIAVVRAEPARNEAGGARNEAGGAASATRAAVPPASDVLPQARALLARPPVERLILDAAQPGTLGGTGSRVDIASATVVAREVPVVLAGGLTAANVAAALRAVPAVGVDVSSGVEYLRGGAVASTLARDSAGRPRKNPFLVGLFVKRAKSARLDLPQSPSRPTPIDPGLLEADVRGRWGTARQFGGRYVPETLVSALQELERAWLALRDDPRYWADLRILLRDYVGRPSPLYRADRLAAEVERRAGREPGRLRLYLKREDLNHTGAHKITNALGQALLTRRLGKSRVIAETGAGQHGVATATACALLGLPCRVFMGREDIRRQAPNVLRMRALGAEVHEVSSGSGTLKDATNEAMRAWVTDVRTTHYVLGSAVGPHPYPTVVRDLQRVIGDEAAVQVGSAEGRLPDAVIACVGGGSNAIGLFTRFLGELSVRIVAVEAAGEGIETGRHAAALAGGTPGILHGSRSYLLQDADGQVLEAVSLSAGLDYPGIGPQLSALFEGGRLEILDATDGEALDALRLLTRTEGIIPALESAHAVAALPVLIGGLRGRADVRQTADGSAEVGRTASGIAGRAARPAGAGPGGGDRALARIAPLPADAVVVLGLSGRGDKDMGALEEEATP